MAPVVERVAESVELGEGPHWDQASQSLYYVDIFGKAIHKYTPSTNQHTTAVLGNSSKSQTNAFVRNQHFIAGKHVGFIVPVEGKSDQFVVGLGRTIALVTWDGVSQEASRVEVLAEVENRAGVDGNRFNDGKADPVGRLWAGRYLVCLENLKKFLR